MGFTCDFYNANVEIGGFSGEFETFLRFQNDAFICVVMYFFQNDASTPFLSYDLQIYIYGLRYSFGDT